MAVVIEEYKIAWKSWFEEEKKQITEALKGYKLEIIHVGSTSIEGMIAKPVIDILLGMEVIDNQVISKLESLGYTYHQNDIVQGRFYLTKRANHDFNINLTYLNNDVWNKILIFHGKLKNSKELQKEYSNLKIRIIKEGKTDLKDYSSSKFSFINKVIEDKDK